MREKQGRREQEIEWADDDFEVEITDLDEPSSNFPGFQRILIKPDSFSRRFRAAAMMAMTGMMALALLLLAAPPVQQWFRHVALATPMVEPGVNFFPVQANPPWGHLFVDGHAVSLSSSGGPLSFVDLSPGQHELTWHAEPFEAQHCIFTVPVGSGADTCKHPLFLPGGTGSPGAVISFPASLDLLPDSQRAALIQAAQTALNNERSSALVQAGEVYALSSDVFGPANNSCKLTQSAVYCFTMAKQPLGATLNFQLDTDTSPGAPCASGVCTFNGEDCRLFCDTSVFGNPTSSPSLWQTFAIVHALWHYATLDGQLIGPEQADTFVQGNQNEHYVLLHITWDGQRWHVATSLSNSQMLFQAPACDAATEDAFSLVQAVVTRFRQSNISIDTVPGITPASGCLVEFTLQSGNSVIEVAYCLHRFGVLLAVNDAAHRLWPFLPVADTYEQQLVKQLAAGK